MKHEKYKELMELNILGELSKEEELELENHLFECTECNEEYVQLKKMYSIIAVEKPKLPTDVDLMNSRKRLFNTIYAEVTQPVLTEKPKNVWDSIFSNKYSFAFGSIVLVLVGFFVGYILFNNSNPSPKLLSENIIDLDKLESGDINISKVNFPEVFSENGEFEFQLSGDSPVNYKGNLNDAVVQKLLANALGKTSNPGFKIRTVNTIAKQAKSIYNPDPQIKNALIYSLKNDENPGVRKGALKALVNFQYEEDIQDALLFTLSNDDNASNRIDAINALLEMNLANYSVDSSLQQLLKRNIPNEENELIKYKTAKLLLGGN